MSCSELLHWCINNAVLLIQLICHWAGSLLAHQLFVIQNTTCRVICDAAAGDWMTRPLSLLISQLIISWLLPISCCLQTQLKTSNDIAECVFVPQCALKVWMGWMYLKSLKVPQKLLIMVSFKSNAYTVIQQLYNKCSHTSVWVTILFEHILLGWQCLKLNQERKCIRHCWK